MISSGTTVSPTERTGAGAPLIHGKLTVISPAYNEADNLPVLYEQLCRVLGGDLDWEWIIVDDHSPDRTFAVITDLARRDPRVRGFRFARNQGAHSAILCGLDQARGDCATVLASDLQDPPEVIPALLDKWRKGARVVWAVRRHRNGEKASTVGFSRLYYFMMRRVVGMREMPPTGADFFLVDRQVISALQQFGEKNTSLLALITWLGFTQATIEYDKQPRLHGHSGWNLEKKLKLGVDSVTSFTYLPIRFMSYIGFVVALLGFIYAGFVIVNALTGHPSEGWSSLMVVVLVVGGIQMLMMGILGEYLWRALDESRHRPRYIIERTTGDAKPQINTDEHR